MQRLRPSRHSAEGPGVIAITGATSGVGRAVASSFAEHGWKVALLARGDDGLAGASHDVERRGGTALPLSVDVSQAAEVDGAAREIERALGEIDVWVNNAMTTVFAYFMDCAPEEYERATEVTYLGTVWGTRSALSLMLPRDRGTIIQVGSALAYRGIPLQAAYCGAKHAIKGFTESVRSELMDQGSAVHVGMVQLPAVNTPQFSHCRSRFDRHPMPVPPIYQPEVAAAAVRLAVAERHREIYLGMPTHKTVAGNKMWSALLDRYLGWKGVESQLSDLPPDPRNEKGNLWEPVTGDPGVRGIFGDEARDHSVTLWATQHRRELALGAAGLAISWLVSR